MCNSSFDVIIHDDAPKRTSYCKIKLFIRIDTNYILFLQFIPNDYKRNYRIKTTTNNR